MRKVIIILALFVCSVAWSQSSTEPKEKKTNSTEQAKQKEKPKKRGDEPKYLIRNKYPFDVFHIYRMNEKTEVKRKYSDGSEKEYTRDVTFYFTLRSPDLVKEGFTKTTITIDSILYEYKSGDKIVKHNTQEDKMPPVDFPDYVYYFLLISKQFDVTYSPYGDVASIGGELLESLRSDYAKISDTAKKEYYLRRLSDFDLSYVVDMTKHVLPTVPMELDTVWNSNFEIELEGMRFSGNGNNKLLKANSQKAVIECQTDTMQTKEKFKTMYDLNSEATIDSAFAVAKYTLDMKGDGAMDYSKAVIDGFMKGKAGTQPFTQTIKRTVIWDLKERYKY